MEGRNEDNTHPSTSCRCRRCSQKLDELEKNGNCSYTRRGRRWHGVARQGKPTRTAQHSVRDPSVYLFVNEGNETGNLIFGLCFPMASLDVDGPHLETGESENGGGQAGHREGQGCGELGTRMLSLDRTAGPAGWIPRPPRSSASVIYEEEREKQNSWGG